MTSQSPPAGDEPNLRQIITTGLFSKGWEPVRNLDQVEKQLNAYILSEIQKAKPEKKQYAEAQDITDHWGMAENSIARQIDNMKGLGYNDGLDDYEQALTAKFRGTQK